MADEQAQDGLQRPSTTSRLWMKDSSGYPSVSITFLFVSFWVTTLAYLLAIVSKIGPIDVRPFDSTASAAYFGMLLSMYVARRFTDAKYGNPNAPTGTRASIPASARSSEGK